LAGADPMSSKNSGSDQNFLIALLMSTLLSRYSRAFHGLMMGAIELGFRAESTRARG
jgi:hypothetical protein